MAPFALGVIVILLVLSFAVLYRFGPNLIKRSAMAMEYPWRGCRSYAVGCIHTAASGLPATFQFIPEDLRQTESSSDASAVALSHRRGYLHRR